MSATIPPPDTISLEAFQAALARYPAVIQAVSDAKGAKDGQPTLAALDALRYAEAPARFGLDGDAHEAMQLDDVKTLVAWKLRHGKFRPTLMKLVASNDAAVVRDTVAEALVVYREARETSAAGAAAGTAAAAALPILCRLRGIGPATASLLLAVHDPQRVPFFADEAYAWLCGGGAAHQAPPAKYNAREYGDVCRAAAALQARLGGSVRAVDVEQVAYVLLRSGQPRQPAKAVSTKTAPKAPKATPKPASKRKRPADTLPDKAGPLRRSQRTRHA